MHYSPIFISVIEGLFCVKVVIIRIYCFNHYTIVMSRNDDVYPRNLKIELSSLFNDLSMELMKSRDQLILNDVTNIFTFR